MKELSCGFLFKVHEKFLGIHPTGNNDYWNIPKGKREGNESHLEAALRELKEETGIIIPDLYMDDIHHIGFFKYQKNKDLYLFYIDGTDFFEGVESLKCVSSDNGFYEVDAYDFFYYDELINAANIRLKDVLRKINKHQLYLQ